jgi:hypothetical protein
MGYISDVHATYKTGAVDFQPLHLPGMEHAFEDFKDCIKRLTMQVMGRLWL